MPKKFNLTSLAKEDLRDIWNYTVETWNEAQADKYLAELYSRFEWLLKNPELGLNRDEVKEGYKSYFQGGHTIFFRETNGDIDILGIPHQSEDIEKHLELDKPQLSYKDRLDQFLNITQDELPDKQLTKDFDIDE